MTGGGPAAVITDLAVLKPNPVTFELEIAEVHPFTTIEEVKKNTGYDIKVRPDVRETDLPGAEEIRIIREELDITGDFTGWKKLFKK
jgi:acyl CoA:acetate/3-ketoacid CoA transferase beta subunit